MPRSGADGGFLSGLKQVLIPDPQPQQQQQQQQPSQRGGATRDYGANAANNVLVDLAPRLVNSSAKILHPATISSHQASLQGAPSSHHHHIPTDPTTLSLRRKLSYVRAGLALGRPNNPLQSWSDLSTQLYLRDRVDELLGLPIPAAPFSFAPTSANTAGALSLEAPPPKPDDPVPLIQGFRATIPAAQASKAERRRRRALVSERALGLGSGNKLGLRQRGDRARGLLAGGGGAGSSLGGISEFGEEEESGGFEPPTIGRRSKSRRKGGGGGGTASSGGSEAGLPLESRADLEKDAKEVEGDMNNVAVRRALLNGQIKDVEGKMAALEKVRENLQRGLLGLREEELELEDELEGIQTRLQRLPLETTVAGGISPGAAVAANGHTRSDSASRLPTSSSRRRKGPAFLPSEHDDLPPNVAFMTLAGHLSPVIALDFTEPYGTLVSSSSDSSVRLWDLTTGTETGFLKGHQGLVKALQVEGSVCVSGGEDGGIRVWDLDKAEEMFYAGIVPSSSRGAAAAALPIDEDVFGPTSTIGAGGLVNGPAGGVEDDGLLREPTSVRDGAVAAAVAGEEADDPSSPCMRNLQGHTKAVTSLFFDGPTLVTGSSDSTLRQWDLTTGQCVQTMDILWAISNPLPSSSVLYPASSYSHSATDPFAMSFSQPPSLTNPSSTSSIPGSPPITPRKAYASSLRRQSSLFESPGAMAAPTTATYADGSWELYDDFVGGVMFWGYALASGTKDGCVRMWDMRTGQAHRTLVGHTGPVTCLQFDEYHLVSGSLDRTIRIWDLRTGAIADTLRYDHAVTSLQFDSRKVVAAAGENSVKVYNRTTMEHSALQLNGHTAPAEKLRFMDRYLASGGRDAMVKIWALQ
ncbi:WD40 repeat-like protein [Rhodotorula sp. JG-1b]|nr:WD40 repeat-like protein [Rhodotorula sp. JG-1b]